MIRKKQKGVKMSMGLMCSARWAFTSRRVGGRWGAVGDQQHKSSIMGSGRAALGAAGIYMRAHK